MDNAVKIDKQGKRLRITIEMETPAQEIILRIDSGRNNPICAFSDISARNPIQKAGDTAAGEIFLPVVDIEAIDCYGVEAGFSPSPEGTFTLNRTISPQERQIAGQVFIPSYQLQEWENIVYVSDARAKLLTFTYLVHVSLPLSVTQRCSVDIHLATKNWSGEIRAYAVREGKEQFIGKACMAWTAQARRRRGNSSLSRAALLDTLGLCVDNLMNSANRCVHSPFHGGMYLLYDLDARTYRQPAWLWSWGPAIRTLLESREFPEITQKHSREDLLKRAYEAGEATLQGVLFQDRDEINGLCTARWDPNPRMPGGVRERINTVADAGFLCGWAWCPLYTATHDLRFWDAAHLCVRTMDGFVEKYGVPPQDYWPEEERFSPHTLDESGFGVEAYHALYRIDKDPNLIRKGAQYMDRHIEKFERPDGLWQRAYYWKEEYTQDCIFMTRGLGWAMEGLLAAYELTHRREYLIKAQRMADQLVANQHPSGCWAFEMNRTPQESGYDDKGTPLWSFLLYRLYSHTGQEEHLAAARSALKYCIENQIIDAEEECIGSIAASSPHSGIVYRPWFEISCLYATSFLALAVMEELRNFRPQ